MLKDVFVIILSSLIGAFASAIIPILAERRKTNSAFNIFWSIKFYLSLIGFLMCILILIIYFIK